MRISRRKLKRVIREQRSNEIPEGNVIGSINANIQGDARYNQTLQVIHDPNTDETTIIVQDAGAVGGMDYQGPGEGRGKYHTIGKQVLPAGTNGKDLIAAIRHMIKRKADTIKMYGAPTKNFTWGLSGGGFHPRETKGLSAAMANTALQRSRGVVENMKITKGQLRRIIRKTISEAKKPPTDATIKPHMSQYQISDDPYEVAEEIGKEYGWSQKQIEAAERLIRKRYIR